MSNARLHQKDFLPTNEEEPEREIWMTLSGVCTQNAPALRGNRGCRVPQRRKVYAKRIENGANERNRKEEKVLYIRSNQNTSRARTGELSPNITLPQKHQVSERKPRGGKNPCPFCSRVSPAPPHAKTDQSRANDAQNNFLPHNSRDRVRPNRLMYRRFYNRGSHYRDNDINQEKATEL